MLFASIPFVFFFFPLVVIGYFLVPNQNYRNAFLLLASLVFYIWGEVAYSVAIFASMILNYTFALVVEKTRERPFGKVWLSLGVIANLSLLVYFKYSSFFASAVGVKLPLNHLPLGISFFTFHGLSFLIDTYRAVVRSEKNPFLVALYFMLFPHQIAGPIVRYSLFNGQVRTRTSNREDFAIGMERFIIGLGKKVLIADVVGHAADIIFATPSTSVSMVLAWLGVICYGMQIYFDFSGYSDMAIGLARIFGFHFHENFRYPYAATSVTDFWKRWHISLSTWFRDYVYIPLGGNRGSRVRTYFNLWIVFLLCGLWHGASWTFLVWGALHGLLLVLERAGLNLVWQRFPILGRGWTLMTVFLAWVLFRVENIAAARQFYRALFRGLGNVGDSSFIFFNLFNPELITVLILAGLFSYEKTLPALRSFFCRTASRRVAFSVGMIGFLFLSMSLLAGGTFNAFIYFRF